MKNAFDAEEETEADWDTMLRDDVRGEAEGKYGPVSDIYVLKESAVRPPSLLLLSSY
jgi:RNA-binding protein 39